MANDQGADVLLNRPHMTITLIAALAANGVIGDRNALLWHISEDLKHFKELTSGHPVIMGRKTYESLGRPLPNRLNIVVSRSCTQIDGCTVAGSLEEALRAAAATDSEECFIIGGAQIYAQAMPLADRLCLTIVERDYEGDTSFPAWDRTAWRLEHCERFACGAAYPHPFRFENYVRRTE